MKINVRRKEKPMTAAVGANIPRKDRKKRAQENAAMMARSIPG
jgi:hypothetical protein